MSIFSANLRHYMEDRHMNQRQLAEAAGLTETSVSRYLNGTRIPNLETLTDLCDALNVTPNDLTGYGRSYMIEGALSAVKACKKAATAAEDLLEQGLKEDNEHGCDCNK